MNVELLKDKEKCCGCMACYNACPVNAIKSFTDENGFIYPKKDIDKCINCNLCIKVCKYDTYDKKNINEKKQAYAAISKDVEGRKKSSSGGVFSALARSWIQEGGVVCGASWMREKSGLIVKHIIIEKIDDICMLQGSKYVQSDAGCCFKSIEQYLKQGKKVMFSGTPCQVDGLKGYLRKDYDNLITIDIICHGVPNINILNDYLEINYGRSKVSKLCFRDKYMGWGMTGYIAFEGKKRYITPDNSSYFYYFLEGNIYRENCYTCPYTNERRPADITIGDYWGINDEHPDFARTVGDGISCVISNTSKGKNIMEENIHNFISCGSTFEQIASHNSQLRKPTFRSKEREMLLEMYSQKGYIALEEAYRRKKGRKTIVKTNIKLLLKNIRNYFKYNTKETRS